MTVVWVVVGILLLPAAFVWALPLMSEVTSLVRAAGRRARTPGAVPDSTGSARRQRILVLVPAHDEALLVESCARSLLQMRSKISDSTIVVIADNCSDTTAALARAAGVQVLERFNTERIGKPHAIAWAFTQVPLATYDAVLIVDADTVVDPGLTDALAATAELKEVAVQAYDGLSNEQETWLSLLAGLLARVRYEGQFLLKRRAGLNCPLTGDGTCLGVELLARAGWAPDALTEGWELYARYTALGERVLYAPEAHVYAQEARTLRQSATQRRRWQTGRLDSLRSYWRALLFSQRCGGRQKLDAFSELVTPGPVVHAGIAIGMAVVLGSMRAMLPRIVAAIFVLSVVPLAIWTIRAWARSSDRRRLAAAIARLPLYMIWRIGLAALALVEREGRWKRSPRHGNATGVET